MALNRFVAWEKIRPTGKELLEVLQTFMGGAGEIENDNDRYYITIPGQQSPIWAQKNENRQRWFEVVSNHAYVNVITRQGDELTNGIAETFADVCAKRWQGIRETSDKPGK